MTIKTKLKVEALQDSQGDPGLLLEGQNSSANPIIKADQPQQPETATEEKIGGNKNSGQGAPDKNTETKNQTNPVSGGNPGDGGKIPSLEKTDFSTPRPGEEQASKIEATD